MSVDIKLMGIRELLDQQVPPGKKQQVKHAPDPGRLPPDLGGIPGHSGSFRWDGQRYVPVENPVSPYQPAADSIFAALGLPEKVINYKSRPDASLAEFNLQTREMTFYQPQDPDEIPPTLAHEMAHQATTKNAADMNPQVEAFTRLFVEKFKSLSVPEQQRHFDRLVERGYLATVDEQLATPALREKGITTVDSLMRRVAAPGRWGVEMQEIIAHAMEDGYRMARAADRNNPAKGREERRAAEQRYPGTQEAFNFFMRAFQASPK